jgi:hypothetical protein
MESRAPAERAGSRTFPGAFASSTFELIPATLGRAGLELDFALPEHISVGPPVSATLTVHK